MINIRSTEMTYEMLCTELGMRMVKDFVCLMARRLVIKDFVTRYRSTPFVPLYYDIHMHVAQNTSDQEHFAPALPMPTSTIRTPWLSCRPYNAYEDHYLSYCSFWCIFRSSLVKQITLLVQTLD